MVWGRLLLIAVLAVAPPSTLLAVANCTGGGDLVTGCIDGPVVEVTGTTRTPGDGGGDGSGSGGGGGTATPGPPVIWKCLEVTCPAGDPDSQPITLTDIATFRPTPGVQFMQPDGWTVPGLDTNFYAVTGVHVVNGTLLGQSAAVRFTPVAFRWDYGDGATATRTTKGGTWAALHVREFDRTPTSHVYARDGKYTIRLVIDFGAEYRFAGSPFYPITGVIPVRANDLHITVDGAKTVLVEHDCVANPTGPGC